MTHDINQVRTTLVNALAEAARAALEYDPLSAAVRGAIPATNPQQFVVAGTAAGIAKMLPTVAPVEQTILTDELILRAAEETAINYVTDERRPDNSTIISFARTIESEVIARLAAPTAQEAEQASAQVGKHMPGWERGIATVTLTGHQLREALDFINPDGDDDVDQRDNELTFGIVQHKDDNGRATTGLCCWNDDSDGVLPLDGAVAATSTGSAPTAARTKEQIIALANASGIDTDEEGDIFGSTNGAIFKFVESLGAPTAAAEVRDAWISVDERLPEKYCLASYRTSRGMQRTIRAMYVKQYEIEATGDECDSETNDADDIDYIKAGWYECIDNWGDYSSVAVCDGIVTHWMPLPEAPAIRSAGSTGEQA